MRIARREAGQLNEECGRARRSRTGKAPRRFAPPNGKSDSPSKRTLRMNPSRFSSKLANGLKQWGANRFLVVAAVFASAILLTVGLGNCSTRTTTATATATTTTSATASGHRNEPTRNQPGLGPGKIGTQNKVIQSATDGTLDQSYTVPRSRPDEQAALRASLLALLSQTSTSPLLEHHLSRLLARAAPPQAAGQKSRAPQFQLVAVSAEAPSAPVPKSAEPGNNRRATTWSRAPAASRQHQDGVASEISLKEPPPSDRTKATFGAARRNSTTAASDPDLMTAASIATVNNNDDEDDAADGRHRYNSNGLVHSQLPLELHLKLKPLALPQPPSTRDEVGSKRRRSIVSIGEQAQTPGRSEISRAAGESKPTAIQSHLETAGWQEAKRVLMLNSIAPPLVQAAHRRLERRHSLQNPGQATSTTTTTTTTTTSTIDYSNLGHPSELSIPEEGREKQLAAAAGESRPSSRLTPGDGINTVAPPTAAKSPKTTTTTTTAAAASGLPSSLSTARTQIQQQTKHGQQEEKEPVRDRLESMYQIKLGDLSIGLPTGQSERPLERLNEPAPFTGLHEDEARIQQMAAAMLPFVWPSFQLTRGQSLGKLRVRSLDSRQRQRSAPTSLTTTPQPMSVTWPMKYQQLSRSDRDQNKIVANLELVTPSSPAAASEFKPAFAELESDKELVGDLEKDPKSIAAGEILMSTTPARPLTSTTTTTTTTSTTTTVKPESDRSGRKRRKKTNGYLQQQRQRLDRQRQQLQMNKERAKKSGGPSLSLVSAIAASSASTTSNSTSSSLGGGGTELGSTATLSISASSPSDSTRLASTQTLPRIKFNVSSAPAAAAAVTAPRSIESPANDSSRAQIPKSLSKLIEQQLAAQSANQTSSSNSTTMPKSFQQNLILLQEYFAARQSWNSSSSDGVARLMKPPTTSVSKVVRLQTGGRGSQEVVPQTSSGTQFDWIKPSPQQRPLHMSADNSSSSSSMPFEYLAPNKARTQQATTASPKTTTTTTAATTTTTTTTSTTTIRPEIEHHEIEAAELGSNKVLPDDEDSTRVATSQPSANTTTTTVSPARSSTSASVKFEPRESIESMSPRRPWQNNKLKKATAGNTNQDNGRNIKLFHFKRKPDMNKLPFYKKPLNYTELGWTAEEIEREQRRLLELQQFSGQLELVQDQAAQARAGQDSHRGDGEKDTATGDKDEIELHTSEDAADQSDSAQAAAQVDSAASGSASELLLLKRKRRAKSQFDRLMAELQAAAAVAAAASEQQSQSLPMANNSAASVEQRVVPVLRKKAEPLVMKPMFFNVNQKRRQTTPSTATNATEPTLLVTTQSTPGQRVSEQEPVRSNTTTTTKLMEGETNRNKPIVRMRRKDNNGEQLGHLTLEPELMTSQWRPTRPSWTPVDISGSPMKRQVMPPAPSEGLVLVPSGLLTPSGTHPMPLIAATSNQRASWKPATEIQPGGAVEQDQAASDQQQQQQPTVVSQAKLAGSSELRVPRLLMKPMRPAKYSLNGYIPKPSLVQIHSAASGPSSSQAHSQPGAIGGGSQQQQAAPTTISGRAGPKPARRNSQQSKQPQNSTHAGKDLDSSTSNEIFSRRRGIEQTLTNDHLRPQQQVISAAAAQLEENKRKYVKQHQEANAFRSPTLSIQKANQIKAKLGLSASLNSIKPRPPATTTSSESESGSLVTGTIDRSQKRSAASYGSWSPVAATNRPADSQQPAAQYLGAASTTRLSTLDPPRSDGDDSDSIAGAPSHHVAGATSFNSIPKTNFDCTNKRGQFVSGLFADVQTGCKVWHLCSNNRKYSFLCPTGTIFNSKVNSCDWKHSAKCGGDS